MLTLSLLAATAYAHSNLIYPIPRNAIDRFDPPWAGGKAPPGPATWGDKHNDDKRACACANGTDICDIGQTCLWMGVGCSIGCKECDGGIINGKPVGANPNNIDRCGSGMNATINDPMLRTTNRECVGDCIGTDKDWTKFNPWRAPGSAPVFDACGMASGSTHPTPGEGYYVETKYAKIGDLGSQLPKQPSGAVWKAGSVVESRWSIRANHGGGWQFRLCKLGEDLTEECFQNTPMPFAGNSRMMMSNGTMLDLNSTFVSEGTLPAGSTWQMLPIPMTRGVSDDRFEPPSYQFAPPCYDPTPPEVLGQGICSGEWISNITMYDQLQVPEHLEPGEYVLGFRWDCEFSAQVWSACADITITK